MEKENIILNQKARDDIDRFERKGNSLVLTAIDGELQSCLWEFVIRSVQVSKKTLKLKRMGVKNLIVLSGDNQGTVDLVANELGLTEALWKYAAGR
jgi:Cd2+/Zn2+-exporting ATPase